MADRHFRAGLSGLQVTFLLQAYAQRPAFGVYSEAADAWQTVTYAQTWERVVELAAGVISCSQ